MTAQPQVALPTTIVDGATLVNAASVMPNFNSLRDGYNSHTHDDVSILSPITDTRNQFQAPSNVVLARYRGASVGQTKNLVEWQRASDGVLIASVSATGRIQSDDGITTKVKSGAIVDADFAATPPDGTVAVNTTANQLQFRSGSSWRQVPTTTIIPIATTLPGSPTDGQEAILTDSLTAPTYQWRFRYNAGSASAYKWEFIGGAPLATENQTGSTTSGAPTAFGTGLVVPRAGDYMILFGAALTRATTTEWLNINLDVGDGTKAAPTVTWARSTTGTEQVLSLAGGGRVLAVAAGGTWRLRLTSSNGTSTVNANTGWFTITPIRVS